MEEPGNSSCNYEPSSSVPADDILLSSGTGALTDAYPSTSTADIFDEKTTLPDCHLSRIIRRRCKFLLPPNISHKLLRIALKQPVTLKRLGRLLIFRISNFLRLVVFPKLWHLLQILVGFCNTFCMHLTLSFHMYLIYLCACFCVCTSFFFFLLQPFNCAFF